MNDNEFRDMLIDYMGKGFLENIIALCRQDPPVCRFIPDLFAASDLRTRLGAMALVEELAREHAAGLATAVPGLIELLRHDSPTLRGDAASALGIIGDPRALPALRALLADMHPGVREAAADALSQAGQ